MPVPFHSIDHAKDKDVAQPCFTINIQIKSEAKIERSERFFFLIIISACMLLINNVRYLSSSAPLILPQSLIYIYLIYTNRVHALIRIIWKVPPHSTGICHYLRFMFLKSKVQLSCSDLCLDHSCHQSKKWEKSKEIQKFYFTDNLPASAKSAAMTLKILGFPFHLYIFTICSGKCRDDSQDFLPLLFTCTF